MSAADAVIKRDFAARRKHFIFTDEHEALRESIRGIGAGTDEIVLDVIGRS